MGSDMKLMVSHTTSPICEALHHYQSLDSFLTNAQRCWWPNDETLRSWNKQTQTKRSDASLFSQPSTGVLLLHTVYLTIWYISKKWVFYQFIQWFHSLFLIFIVFCLTTWFTIGEKVNPPQFKFSGREEWGLMTFSFLQGESQMWPSSLDSTLLSVRYRGRGVIRDVAYKQPVIIPPQLRGLVSFSRSLYTLQHLYDKKVWQTLFNVKATIFYTCKTLFFFFFQNPGHWDVGCSPCLCLWNQSEL